MIDLFNRLLKLSELETEFIAKAVSIFQPSTALNLVELFALGAANRTLAQSRGFRSMIDAKNFPSAAILLRTQIDTAMRLNGIKYLDQPDVQLGKVLEGSKIFRQLVSSQKTEKGRAIQMTDSFLLERLEEDVPWIGTLYKETSDFVHLSFRHLFTSVASTDDASHIVNFAITGEDSAKDESVYYEICDHFFSVSKLTFTIIIGLSIALHGSDMLQET